MNIHSELLQAGHKFRKELLMMPVAQLKPIIQHMTLRKGIRGKETVGEMTGDIEIRPYKSEKGATDSFGAEPRTLETFMGDVVEEFDPYKLSNTIYGDAVGKDQKSIPMAKKVALRMAQLATKNLAKNIGNAVRNSSGTKTVDLFDGFVTIANKEIAAGRISTEKGNMVDLPVLTFNNVVDKLQEYYQDGSSEELQEQQSKLFLPRNIYNMYCKAYKAETGATPYNTQYKKTFLEGTDDHCELVPSTWLRNSSRLILSTKDNMLVGVDQMSDIEKVRIRECDNPKALQFFMVLYFGTQFETISKEMFNIGKIATS